MIVRVFDIETNGLNPDTVWCLSMESRDKEDMKSYYKDEVVDNVEEGVIKLFSSDVIVGHNALGFDIPVLERIFGIPCKAFVLDTYVLSYMYHTGRKHSLEYYGDMFGRPKPKHEDWTQFSAEMLYRNREDVAITKLTLNYLLSSLSIQLEELVN